MPKAQSTTALKLDPRGIYRTPTGRLCRLRDVDWLEPAMRNGAAVAHLEYLRPDGWRTNTNIVDGFSLQRANWGLLRLVGQQTEGVHA